MLIQPLSDVTIVLPLVLLFCQCTLIHCVIYYYYCHRLGALYIFLINTYSFIKHYTIIILCKQYNLVIYRKKNHQVNCFLTCWRAWIWVKSVMFCWMWCLETAHTSNHHRYRTRQIAFIWWKLMKEYWFDLLKTRNQLHTKSLLPQS